MKHLTLSCLILGFSSALLAEVPPPKSRFDDSGGKPAAVVPPKAPVATPPKASVTPSSKSSAGTSKKSGVATPKKTGVPIVKKTGVTIAQKTPAKAPSLYVPPRLSPVAPVPAEGPSLEDVGAFVTSYLKTCSSGTAGDLAPFYAFPIGQYFKDMNVSREVFQAAQKEYFQKTPEQKLSTEKVMVDKREGNLWRVQFTLSSTGRHWKKNPGQLQKFDISYTVYAEVIWDGQAFRFTRFTNEWPASWK